MRLRLLSLVIVVAFVALVIAPAVAQEQPARSPEYQAVQQKLAVGWNTWDTYNVFSHVLLPEGLGIDMEIDRGRVVANSILGRAIIGNWDSKVTPGPHTYGPGYNELTVDYKGLKFKIEGAVAGKDLVLLVTPMNKLDAGSSPEAIFHAGMLWNRPGYVERVGDHLRATLPSAQPSLSRQIDIFAVGAVPDKGTNGMFPESGPYIAVPIAGPLGISTGHRRTLEEVQAAVHEQRAAYDRAIAAHKESAELADAIETVIGWDTIYEPEQKRVLSPVTRSWNGGFGGFVLFDWDTYFAAYQIALDNKDLAYANAIEMSKAITPEGIVPNFAGALKRASYDRSEPPVGSIVTLAIYHKYKEAWFLKEVYNELLKWNRWWAANRDMDGYMVLGSTPFDNRWTGGDSAVGILSGSILESGLDNSPMYDGAPFDAKRHLMQQADVGLMGLYIADCDALAEIATVLHKDADAAELRARQKKYGDKLQTLWDEKSGQFLNRNLVTGQFNPRTAPNNFYPMLAKVATPQQAERMVREHLLNEKEFWGEYVVPSTPRNDPAFGDNNYWRGRIWGPMNLLVYLGLRNYNFPQVRAELASKSAALFRKEWTEKRHVHENYNPTTGVGCDVTSSDPFYHWGALLMYLSALERGEM